MQKNKYQDYACIDFLRSLSGIKGMITREQLSSGIDISTQDYVHRKLEEIVKAVDNSDMGNGHGQKEAVYRKVIEVYQHLFDG